MQHDASMAIVVSNPVRRPLCFVHRNVRYGSQGTHREQGPFKSIHGTVENTIPAHVYTHSFLS